jgi:hypothetical protein
VLGESLLRGTLVVVAVLGVAVPARLVRAQAGEAEAQIRQGLELRRQGLDARALPFFENAYRLARNARTAAQLGLEEMALGYWMEADQYLTEALTVADHPWVAKNKGTLEEARTKVRAMIGELTITGGPAGAEVVINGQAAGRLPLSEPIRLAKGAAQVELRAPGYEPASRMVTVPGGSSASVSLLLVRTPSRQTTELPATTAAAGVGVASADTTSPPPTSSGAQPSVIIAGRDLEPRPEASHPSGARPLAWTLGSVGLAAGAFGVFETVAMVGKKNDFNNHTVASPTPQDPNRRVVDCTTSALTDECSRLRDAYSQARTLAIVGYAAGGALVATSAVLLAVSSSRERPSGNGMASVTCVPTVGVAGASCALRF